jgi:hypothetical protein
LKGKAAKETPKGKSAGKAKGKQSKKALAQSMLQAKQQELLSSEHEQHIDERRSVSNLAKYLITLLNFQKD